MSVEDCLKVENSRSVSPWRLTRVDVRTRMTNGNEVAARVEVIHELRGKVSDLATGQGGLETAFHAIAQIIGIEATLERLDVRGGYNGSTWQVSACVCVRQGLLLLPGFDVAGDVLTASCGAFIKALTATAQASNQERPRTCV